MRRRVAAVLMLASLPWAGVDAQQTATATFRVSATVQSVCSVTATDLAFGAYASNAGSPLTGTTVLKVTCTPSTSYNVGLDAGTSTGATVNARKMVSGTSSLNYQLYSDSQHTKIWGNTQSTDTVVGVGTGLEQQLTVYGRVPASQLVAAGAYQDTITVRVFY